MRIIHIFTLYLQGVFEQRLRSFIWFLLPVMNASLYILFWRGALVTNRHISANWDLYSLTAYYILLIIAGTLNSHVEERIADTDIRKGELSNFLLKPFPYFWFKFFGEVPYRLLQGSYALIVFFFCMYILHLVHLPVPSFFFLLQYVVIAILAFFIMFVLKMIVGLSAIFSTEIYELRDVIEICQFIFAGLILPIDLFPSWLYHIATFLPFAYATYFPVIAVEGKLSQMQLFHLLQMQLVWLLILLVVYQITWRLGLRRYTGFGQ